MLPTKITKAMATVIHPTTDGHWISGNPELQGMSATTLTALTSLRCHHRGLVVRRLRVDADVVLERDLLDGHDVLHEVLDLLVVQGPGEPHAPRRHVRPRTALHDRVSDIHHVVDLRVVEGRAAAHRPQIGDRDQLAVEDVVSPAQGRVVAVAAHAPDARL